MSTTYQASFAEVKSALRGQNAAVGSYLGLPADFANKRHHRCPRCEKEKFRISDPQSLEGGCDSCGATWGDVVGLAAFALGIGNGDACQRLAEQFYVLGDGQDNRLSYSAKSTVPPPAAPLPSTPQVGIKPEDGLSAHSQSIELIEWNESLADLWCIRNGIAEHALSAVGARRAKWKQFAKSQPQSVIAIPVYGGDELQIVNWTIYSATGGMIETRARSDSGKWVSEHVRKRVAFSGSDRVGVSMSLAARDAILAGTSCCESIAIKTEGITDLLATLSIIPDASSLENIVWTNSDGARSTNTAKWFLPMLSRLDPQCQVVIHDRDEAGELGAEKWTDEIRRYGCVKNVILDLPYSKTKGKDLRDYIQSCNGDAAAKWEMLLSIIDAAPTQTVIIESAADGRSTVISDASEHPGSDVSDSATVSTVIDFQAVADRPPQHETEKVDYSHFESEHVDDPHRLAKSNLKKYEASNGGRLVFWQSDWFKYKDGRYQPISHDELSAKLNHSIRKDFETSYLDELADYVANHSTEPDKEPPKIRKVTRTLVNNVIGAMEGMCLLPGSITIPCWLPDRTERNYLSFANCLLDVHAILNDPEKSKCILPHSADWFCMSRLDYKFDPNALASRWLEYLDYSLDGDEERISILQEWAGYLLLPKNYLQRFLVLEGEGGNGKTVYNAAIEAMLGQSNVSHVSIEQFGDRFALASTLGKAANISGDAGEIDGIAEGVLKQFTGGDQMQFDRKNRQPISARPTAKLMAAWNSRPRIKDRSQGFWRRMLLVPFDRKIPPHRRVLGMDSPAWWIDQGEAPGILNWALKGLLRLKKNNVFTESKRCDDAMKEYKVDSNPAAEFLADHVEFKSGAKLDSKKIYEWYVFWSRETGHHPLSATGFGKEVHRQFPLVEKKRDRNLEMKKLENVYFGLQFSVSEILGEKIPRTEYAN